MFFSVQVFQGHVYFYDALKNNIQRFNIAGGAGSLEPFGPPSFYRIQNLAFFSTEQYKKDMSKIDLLIPFHDDPRGQIMAGITKVPKPFYCEMVGVY